MSANVALLLHEEVLLLALHDRKGTTPVDSMYQYAIAGGILGELLLNRRVRVTTRGKKKLAEVEHDDLLGNALLDDCLARVREAKKPATLSTWVSRFSRTKKLKHKVAAGLCDAGILKMEERRILGIFSRTTYLAVDPQPKRALVKRLHTAVFSDVDLTDPRTIVLISVAHGADLLGTVFGKKQLKARKPRIEEITSAELVGEATRKGVEAARLAAIAATGI